jgi:hypothetical protein
MNQKQPINALLCFSRQETQTPEEVFEMIQERMITMLGCSYYQKGIGIFNWNPNSKATYEEIEAITDWQHSSIDLTVKDFDRLGEVVGLSITEVLGYPHISPEYKEQIENQLSGEMNQVSDFDTNGFDPAAIFVILSTLDEIDDFVTQKKILINK